MKRSFGCVGFLAGVLCMLSGVLRAEETEEHGFANSGDVRIHYVTAGKGPLVILIHGFPDYWYTWRRQIPELARHFQVVAIDLRGYNRSDQPEGIENYRMEKLLADVSAVLHHFKRQTAVIVGHDWGGGIAWSYAMAHPEKVDRLVILNLPHLHCLQRELAGNPEQQKASAYARFFQKPDAASTLTPEGLASWVQDADARQQYVAAFRRSSLEGMLNYYKANYPREPYKAPTADPPKVKCPVLMIHGLKDRALLQGALNGTWNWIEKDLTLVTLPDAGHFVQQDAPETVTRTMLRWLTRDDASDPR